MDDWPIGSTALYASIDVVSPRQVPIFWLGTSDGVLMAMAFLTVLAATKMIQAIWQSPGNR